MSAALNVRRLWMELMGLSEEEIDVECKPGTPADLDEELAELQSICRIKDEEWRVQSGLSERATVGAPKRPTVDSVFDQTQSLLTRHAAAGLQKIIHSLDKG
jgi:hypothetical protein